MEALAAAHRQLAWNIALELRAAGFSAYLVGGAVRDQLLRREASDFDVATSATPEQVLRQFPGAQLVGAHFGVVLVRQAGAEVEVATYRSDLAYHDGRHPERVRFETSPEADVLRRDFTINALLLDPESDRIIDYVDGQGDLARKLIRAIGDPRVRFEEDHLRMLRAVRFAARLGFDIEPATFEAIRRQRASIHRISAERIRDELSRILTEGGARRGFELLDATGLLEEILPEVARYHGVEQPPEYHPEGDVWIHTMLMLEGLRSPTSTLAWGALLHDVGKPPTFRIAGRIRFDGHVEEGVRIARNILERLRFSKDDARQVEALIENHMRFMHVFQMKESTLKRFLSLPRFDEHLELHRQDCLSSNGRLEGYEYLRRRFDETPPSELRPPPLLNGNDLLALGYRAGPRLGRMLRWAEDAQLDGRIGSKEEAIDLLLTEFGPPPE